MQKKVLELVINLRMCVTGYYALFLHSNHYKFEESLNAIISLHVRRNSVRFLNTGITIGENEGDTLLHFSRMAHVSATIKAHTYFLDR